MKCNRSLSAQDILQLPDAEFDNNLGYYSDRLIIGTLRQFHFTTVVNGTISFHPSTIGIYWYGTFLRATDYYRYVMNANADGQQFIVAHSIGLTVSLVLFILSPITMVCLKVVGAVSIGLLLKRKHHLNRADHQLPSSHCLMSRICWIGVRDYAIIWKQYKSDVPYDYRFHTRKHTDRQTAW